MAVKNGKEPALKRLSRLIAELGSLSKTEKLELFTERLERIRSGRDEPEIKPLELYLDVVESIRDNSKDGEVYGSLLEKAIGLYDELFVLGEETPDLEEKAMIYRALVVEDAILAKGLYDSLLFSSFHDKENYIVLVREIMPKKYAHDIFLKIRKHALDVREFLLDDIAYLMHLIRVAERLSVTGTIGGEAVLEEELLKLRRTNGLYDIDPLRLAQAEKNVSEAAAIVECGREMLQLLERRSGNVEKLAEEAENRAQEARRLTEVFLEGKTKNAKAELEAAVKEYKESQKKTVFMEKELFLKQVFSDAESDLNRYRSEAKVILATAAAELNGLRREADQVIRRVENAAADDEKVRTILERSRNDEELMALIERLNSLKGKVPEAELRKTEPAAVQKAGAQEEGTEEPAVVREETAGEKPAASSYGSGVKTLRPIPAVNPLLDWNVPFQDRFALVMKEKERRMERGELFHAMFDDVITAVMENVNPYLIGPSGCGKTFMVKQVGELLGLDCTDIGYINEEYDILGYVTAGGTYNESNFYRLYKYGGIVFCDELDNGNSKATVKLNSFLTNQKNSYYHFPGGERVERHPNFRVIAAGNTDGSGADTNYSTREKIEESVLQRMIPIYMDYDNRVEEQILKDYPDWFEFGCAFRKATDEWEKACGIPAQGIFTTRDAYRIRQYLENSSFSNEKIMNYEFVQTKEAEYLGFLQEKLSGFISESSGAYALYRLFVKLAEAIREKGKRV
ncbi:MAG: AAA family ATPase [Lachnospiraceae bacterium]|nr:AAA family ATPase [Lachnospiraceae bacterium]